jgi:hypothetical protein
MVTLLERGRPIFLNAMGCKGSNVMFAYYLSSVGGSVDWFKSKYGVIHGISIFDIPYKKNKEVVDRSIAIDAHCLYNYMMRKRDTKHPSIVLVSDDKDFYELAGSLTYSGAKCTLLSTRERDDALWYEMSSPNYRRFAFDTIDASEQTKIRSQSESMSVQVVKTVIPETIVRPRASDTTIKASNMSATHPSTDTAEDEGKLLVPKDIGESSIARNVSFVDSSPDTKKPTATYVDDHLGVSHNEWKSMIRGQFNRVTGIKCYLQGTQTTIEVFPYSQIGICTTNTLGSINGKSARKAALLSVVVYIHNTKIARAGTIDYTGRSEIPLYIPVKNNEEIPLNKTSSLYFHPYDGY